MMEPRQREHQLDLLVKDKSENQRLDPVSRSDVINLLKLLLNECVTNAAKVMGANNE
jgi:hypothetical protein